MAEIKVQNVTKVFGKNATAVDNLSLQIQSGEFLVLLGPSGCGKTTTLRMIAGLERQSSGSIFIGERCVDTLPPGKRDIAFVFQFYALYPHLTVYDNISFPLRAQNLPKAEVQKRVTEVANRLRIDHILNRRPNKLPGGEQQRVALARAMVRNPQVFLMDEPLTNLDASLRNDMRVELKHLQHELATTMIYVTHDQVEAMSMSHRIAVMDFGVLQQIDTPLNVYKRPQTLFVASFIGTPPMNILPCLVRENALEGVENAFRYTLAPEVASRLSNGQKVYFGVRAEDINIEKADGNVPDSAIKGRVYVREPLGDEVIYYVELEGYSLRVKSSPQARFDVGDWVTIAINAKNIHLFDHESEQSLL